MNDLWKFAKPLFDIYGDGKTDLYDFNLLADEWLNSCSSPSWCNNCDIDYSGNVNLADFEIMATMWLVDCNITPNDAACIPQ